MLGNFCDTLGPVFCSPTSCSQFLTEGDQFSLCSEINPPSVHLLIIGASLPLILNGLISDMFSAFSLFLANKQQPTTHTDKGNTQARDEKKRGKGRVTDRWGRET